MVPTPHPQWPTAPPALPLMAQWLYSSLFHIIPIMIGPWGSIRIHKVSQTQLQICWVPSVPLLFRVPVANIVRQGHIAPVSHLARANAHLGESTSQHISTFRCWWWNDVKRPSAASVPFIRASVMTKAASSGWSGAGASKSQLCIVPTIGPLYYTDLYSTHCFA